MRLRPLLLALALAGTALAAPPAAAPVDFPVVRPGREFQFPRDHGAHPDYRTEWWYVTGWLEQPDGSPLGFQLTFFRSRPGVAEDNPSAFAPKQILLAHAALSDPATGRLRHDQQAARTGFGLAAAAVGDTDLVIKNWSFRRLHDGSFAARIPASGFTLDLRFHPTQPLLAHGRNGYSRKGPRPEEASYYYSLPQMRVSGFVAKSGRRLPVRGTAWLDREWFTASLAKGAVGWDWTGINFDNGGALMAFQVRGSDGRALYAGGTLRRADKSEVRFGPNEVRFLPRRRWRSPKSGGIYPVEADFVVRLPEGERRFRLKPLFDAQELHSGGAMPTYWEGAVTTAGGRGYLELTGYAGAVPIGN